MSAAVARRVVVAVLLAGACKPLAPPPTPENRQQIFAERILSAATSNAPRSEEEREDVGLALESVVIPSMAPRLRLLAAGSDEIIARGAAEALVSIRTARWPENPDVLLECARAESNAAVQAACVERLSDTPETRALVVELLDAEEPVLRHAAVVRIGALPQSVAKGTNGKYQDRKDELPARHPVRRAAELFPDLLRSDGPAPPTELIENLRARSSGRQRSGLHRLLGGGGWRIIYRATPRIPEDPRVAAALAALADSSDESVRLLASAALLRQSLVKTPPPMDPQ